MADVCLLAGRTARIGLAAVHTTTGGRHMTERSLDELARSIVSKSALSTIQRSVDRHIDELDFWLHTEGVRLQVVCERLATAGLTRPSGQPLTWRWLGAVVARARKRKAAKPAPAPGGTSPPRPTERAPAPVGGSPPPRPAEGAARESPPFDPYAPRSGRGLESLAGTRLPPPKGSGGS